jgi:hypothetical protein
MLFLTVDRLQSSAIHPWTARSTAPLVIIRGARWPSEGTALSRARSAQGQLGRCALPEDRDLVAEHEDLDVLGGV